MVCSCLGLVCVVFVGGWPSSKDVDCRSADRLHEPDAGLCHGQQHVSRLALTDALSFACGLQLVSPRCVAQGVGEDAPLSGR